tara:strand:- start:31 stop:390 length:360 start_codon:yes stop_codon:yes gene_type:complete
MSSSSPFSPIHIEWITPRTVQPAALAASLSAPPRGSRLAAAAPPSHVRRLLETSLHVAARRLAAAATIQSSCRSFRALFAFFQVTEIGTKARCDCFERFLSRVSHARMHGQRSYSKKVR